MNFILDRENINIVLLAITAFSTFVCMLVLTHPYKVWAWKTIREKFAICFRCPTSAISIRVIPLKSDPNYIFDIIIRNRFSFPVFFWAGLGLASTWRFTATINSLRLLWPSLATVFGLRSRFAALFTHVPHSMFHFQRIFEINVINKSP